MRAHLRLDTNSASVRPKDTVQLVRTATHMHVGRLRRPSGRGLYTVRSRPTEVIRYLLPAVRANPANTIRTRSRDCQEQLSQERLGTLVDHRTRHTAMRTSTNNLAVDEVRDGSSSKQVLIVLCGDAKDVPTIGLADGETAAQQSHSDKRETECIAYRHDSLDGLPAELLGDGGGVFRHACDEDLEVGGVQGDVDSPVIVCRSFEGRTRQHVSENCAADVSRNVSVKTARLRTCETSGDKRAPGTCRLWC